MLSPRTMLVLGTGWSSQKEQKLCKNLGCGLFVFFNPETALNDTTVVNICHYTFVKTPEKYTSHWKD